MTHKVLDGGRTLQFEGERLAHSSSKRRTSTRWIQFDLYRTEAGQYVLSRVGVSRLYHSANCRMVEQYDLLPAPAATLHMDAVPCELCDPDVEHDNDLIYPENDRHWAQVCPTPETVLRAVERRNDSNATYLTRVAEDLLEEAAMSDDGIARAFRVQNVP